jgi:hypothetical protein
MWGKGAWMGQELKIFSGMANRALAEEIAG